MKLSLWNSYIELEDGLGLIYNSLKDSFLVITDSELFKLVRLGRHKRLPSHFIQQLNTIGALVTKNKDEVQELEDIIRTIDEDESRFQIIINPTLDCNFHCWYCYENHIKGSKMSSNTIHAIKKYLENKVKSSNQLKYLELSFFVGEPLMQFHNVVIPLLKYTSNLCKNYGISLSTHFTTNAGLLSDEIISELKVYSPTFQITLDGDEEAHNGTRFFKGRKPSFNIIVNNIFNLVKNGMNVLVRINYTHSNINSINGIIDKLSQLDFNIRNKVRVDFQQVWQDKYIAKNEINLDSTIKRFRISLQNNGFEVSYSEIFNYVTNSCYADKRNQILINYNGDIFKCTARDFKSENRMGILLENGIIDWVNNSHEIRMNCKLKKTKCRECRIAPICGGGCRTKCLENQQHDDCNLGFNSNDVDNLILERFEQYFILK